MALLLAESLLEREGFDARDQVERFVRWQREVTGSATGQCVGIPANVAGRWPRPSTSASRSPVRTTRDSSTRTRCRASRPR